MITRSVLVGVLVAGSMAVTMTAAGARTEGRATIDVTGTWRFKTNSPNFCFPSCVYYFKLVQEGAAIRGTDGTHPILGSLNGNEAVFTTYTGISEDNITIDARVGPQSQRMVGAIENQIEPPAPIAGVRVSTGS